MDLMSVAEGASQSNARKGKNIWSAGKGANAATPPAPLDNADRALAASLAAMKELDMMQANNTSKASPSSKSPSSSVKKSTEGGSATTTSAATRTPPATTDTTGDWICQTCSTKGLDCTLPADFGFCSTCGESKDGEPSRHPAPAQALTDADDFWTCHCGESCPPSFLFCVECGFPAGSKPPPPPSVCGGCDEALPDSFKFCPDCGTRAGEWPKEKITSAAAAQAVTGTDWQCKQCGNDLPGDFRFCPFEGAAKPS